MHRSTSWPTLERQIPTAVHQPCLFKCIFQLPGQLSRGTLQRLFSNVASSTVSLNFPISRGKLHRLFCNFAFLNASFNFLANSRKANSIGCSATLPLQTHLWTSWQTLEKQITTALQQRSLFKRIFELRGQLSRGRLQRLFSNFSSSNASFNFLSNSREANYNGCWVTFPLQTQFWTSWPTFERQITMAPQQRCLFKSIFELPGKLSRGKLQRLFNNVVSSNASLIILANSREAHYNGCSATLPLQPYLWTSWPTLEGQITIAVQQLCLFERIFELPGKITRSKLQRLFSNFASSNARLNITAISLDENFKSSSQILPLQTHLRTSWPTLKRQITTAVQQLCLFKRIFELPGQLSRGILQRLFNNVASSNASSNFLANSREANCNGCSATLPLQTHLWTSWPTLERGKFERLFSNFASSNASFNFLANSREANSNGCSPTLPLQMHLSTSWPTFERQITTAVLQLFASSNATSNFLANSPEANSNGCSANCAPSNASLNFLANSREARNNGCSATLLPQTHLPTSWQTLERGKFERLFSNFSSSNASFNFLANSREANYNGCSPTFPLQTQFWTSWPTLERQITTAVQQLCLCKRIFELPSQQISTAVHQLFLFKRIFQLPGQLSRGKFQRLFTNLASSNASFNFLANSRKANYNGCSATLPLQQHLWTSWQALEKQITTALQQRSLFKRIFELPGQLSRGKLQRLFTNLPSANAVLNFLANSREANSNGCSPTLPLQIHLSTSWPTFEKQTTTAVQQLCLFKCIFELPGQLSRGKFQRLLSNFASSNASLNFLAKPREAYHNGCSATLPLQTHLWTSSGQLSRGKSQRLFSVFSSSKRISELPDQLWRGILQRLFSNVASANAVLNHLANSREAHYNCRVQQTLPLQNASSNLLANSREAHCNGSSATLSLQMHLWSSWPTLERRITTAVEQLSLCKRIFELPGQLSRGKWQRLFNNVASSDASSNYPGKLQRGKLQRLFSNSASSNASFNFLANTREANSKRLFSNVASSNAVLNFLANSQEANYNGCSASIPLQKHGWTSQQSHLTKISKAVHKFCLFKRIFELPGQLSKSKFQKLFSNFGSSNASSNFLTNSREANFNGCSATLPLQTHLRTSWPTLERQISTAIQQLCLFKRIFEPPDQLSRGKKTTAVQQLCFLRHIFQLPGKLSREANLNGCSATLPLQMHLRTSWQTPREANYNGCSATLPLQKHLWTSWQTLERQITTAVQQLGLFKSIFELPGKLSRGK